MIMLTVTVHKSGMPSQTQMHSSPFWKGSPSATSASASALVLASGIVVDNVLMISRSMMLMSTTTTTRIQLLMHCSSMSGEMLHLDISLSLQKWGNKVGKGKGKRNCSSICSYSMSQFLYYPNFCSFLILLLINSHLFFLTNH